MASIQHATFGAGCFWGVEWVFRKVPGVLDAVSGYAGGTMADPTYRDVCGGRTGHAEVVDVTFDADVVTYDQLLEVFWAMHDPTQVNRQGPDRGEQYRSAILVRDDEQREAAERSRDRAQGSFGRPIATSIEVLERFYPAEAYHQRYYEGNGHTPYCHVFPTDVVERLGLGATQPR
jgi:peptide-methionine (S)-S-oxide reductase